MKYVSRKRVQRNHDPNLNVKQKCIVFNITPHLIAIVALIFLSSYWKTCCILSRQRSLRQFKIDSLHYKGHTDLKGHHNLSVFIYCQMQTVAPCYKFFQAKET